MLNPLAQALAWLGRQSTRALVVIVLIGIAVPPFGAQLKPYVTEAIFLLLFTAFLRVDMGKLREQVKRPAFILAGTAWTTLGVPILFGITCLISGVEAQAPDLFLGLMLQAIATPIMSSPAFAMLMGLDATLIVVMLVTTAAVTPFTAALFAGIMGLDLDISPLALGSKLFIIVAGSALLAAIVRKLAGFAAVTRHSDKIDGINILLLFIFVAAIMESVGANFLTRPLLMLGLTGLAFAVFIAILTLTILAFSWAGRSDALSLGFMSAQRNMGLMLAATGGAVPELTWLYFAIAQFPIYLSPYLFARPIKWAIGR